MNDQINYSARNLRHEKIWIKSIEKKVKERSWFFDKVFTCALFIILVNFVSTRFYTYQKDNYEFVPNVSTDKKIFVLEEDWFVLKKETQTERRKTWDWNKIFEHIIKEWDTLSWIARDYQIKVSTILDANPGLNPWQALKIWKVLKILPVDWISIFLNEDTEIDSIAKKYKISPESIIKQNLLWSWSLLVKKWITLILPWAKEIAINQNLRNENNNTRYWNYAPKNWSKYQYKWEISWDFIKPCDWWITQYYHRWHYALDIANRNKWPIYATAAWVVTYVNYWWNWWYWNMIIIDHWKWVQSLYWHNEKLYVKVWDVIKQWQTIAWMWRSWRVRWKTWIHLHFEIIINWVKRNPLAYF